jgi:CBS domain-containing protein
MAQNIKDVMTSNPCTIDADKSVAYAATMMRDEDVGLAPIVEGDKLVGMLTDRDIATRVAAQGRDPEQVKVRDVASTELVTIDPQQDLDEALRIMAAHQIRRLPVVEEDGRLVGVVAQADIAREGDELKTGRLVEEISESGGQMSSIEGQYQSQFERRPEGLEEPQPTIGEEKEPREEESISRVRAASSRGRRRTTRRATTTRARSTGRRKKTTTRRKSTARKTTGARKTTRGRKTTTRRAPSRAAAAKGGRKTARKRTTGGRKKRTTTRRAPSRAAAAKGGRKTTRKRATGTRKKRTTARRTTGTRKRTTTRRKTTSTRRSTSGRKTTTRRAPSRAAAAKGGRKSARKRTTRRRTSS